MPRLKTLKSPVQTLNTNRVKTVNRYGMGGAGFAPGRDKRRERIFKRDKYLCRNCFENGIIKPLHLHSKDPYAVGYVDEYIPRAQGGEEVEPNMWLLCKDCHDPKSLEDSRGVVREPRDFGYLSEGGPVIA